MRRHNLWSVYSFEIVRTLNKARFWLMTLTVPAIVMVVVALSAISSSTAGERADSQKGEEISFTFSDSSGYVDADVATALGGVASRDSAAAIEAVKAGTVDAHFVYAQDPSVTPTQVYGIDEGIFQNGKYASVATYLLLTSAQKSLDDPTLGAIFQADLPVVSTTFLDDGAEAGGVGSVIFPLLFVVLLYLMVLLLGNQMLSTTLEEKENRVMEMVLTTVSPTSLIMGKVLSIFTVGIVQVAVFAVPVVIGFVFFRDSIAIPNFDVSTLVIDPGKTVVGALLLLGGFTLFTGTLVAVGAVVPTAKESGQAFAVVVVLMFLPFYAMGFVISDPQSPLVQLFTYFPYSTATTAMLRNAFGALALHEAIVAIVLLFGLGIAMLAVAVRLFRHGSVEYNRKVSLRALGRS